MMHNMSNYEQICKDFKWEIPEEFNFGYDIIDNWASASDKLALITVDDVNNHVLRHTFQQLAKFSNRFANVLTKHGVNKGDRVLVMLGNVPEWYIVVLGIIKVGAIFMPTPTLSTHNDIKYRVEQSEAMVAITSLEYIDRFKGIKKHCPSLRDLIVVNGEADGWLSYDKEMSEASEALISHFKTKSCDPMLIYFTSGTTGYPKMVLHTHAYAIAQAMPAKYVYELTPVDLHWTIADTGWAKTAWGKLFGQWFIGSALFQHKTQGKFDAKRTLELLEGYGITAFCAPPTVYRMLVLEDLSQHNFRTLHHCLSAGEPLNAEVIRRWKQYTGLDIYDFYGQTETVCLVANYPSMQIKPGSMGKPTPGHIIDIIDDEGNELPVDKVGNIAVRINPLYPPGLLKEYWKNRKAMKESFRGNWYYTGDTAYKDADGYLWFVGRSDDIIKASGYRIGPFEVESALLTHPAVAESAVIGVPDEVRGQIVKAFVVLSPGYEASKSLTAQLQKHVKKVSAPYKYPRQIEYVTQLPKTLSGKILRKELRKLSIKPV